MVLGLQAGKEPKSPKRAGGESEDERRVRVGGKGQLLELWGSIQTSNIEIIKQLPIHMFFSIFVINTIIHRS